MSTFQQQQQQAWGGGSNRIAAINEEGSTPEYFPTNSTHFNDFHGDSNHDEKTGWRKFLSFVGPGFLVSLAYIDPGNMETDLQAGASHGYKLLWVVFYGFVFAFIIQSLAANLGVSTGKHLSELCKAEYPTLVKYFLYLLAEVAAIAADIPEVIGSAVALNILFHIPLWVGVLCTGLSTILLLGLQRYGVRKLETLIAVLVFVIAGCFFAEMSYVKPSASDVIKNIFVPAVAGNGAIGDAIAILGQSIQPTNLFLHSALVLSRKVPKSVRSVNAACKYFQIESGVALILAFSINVAIVTVTATVCSADSLSSNNQDRCNNLTLDSASFLLKNVLGKSSSILYGIALLVSGQSSAITGTFAGQFIMEGFLDLKMKKWVRNLMTRCIAIAPSLIVSIIAGSQGAGRLIIITSIILSFELPFVLIPLLKFSSSSTKMGPYKNSIYIIVLSWIFVAALISINVYFLSTSFVDWLLHNNLPKVGNIFIGVIVFPLMAVYILAIIYLTFRKDSVVTYNVPQTNDPEAIQARIESGRGNPDGYFQADNDPYRERIYREDLSEIPLPE